MCGSDIRSGAMIAASPRRNANGDVAIRPWRNGSTSGSRPSSFARKPAEHVALAGHPHVLIDAAHAIAQAAAIGFALGARDVTRWLGQNYRRGLHPRILHAREVDEARRDGSVSTSLTRT